MPKPYCVELRERAVAAFDAGRLQAEAVQLFKISLASLKRWLAQRRAGQSLAPKTYRPGPRGAFGTPEALAALEAQLQAEPDGRLLDRPSSTLAGAHRSARQPDDFTPGPPRFGLDAQKKSSRPANAMKPSGPTGVKRTRHWNRPT
jgi:hypothetical protein